MIDRRELLAKSSLLLAGATLGGCAATGASGLGGQAAERSLPPLFADIEQRTFRYFWETASRENGLVPDRWPSPSFCSIAAVGFALTCYPIGVERGWCSRAAARDLTLTTLRFFWNAPQSDAPAGFIGYKGFFYHFIDMRTGARFDKVDLSSVDSTILFMGMLLASAYFDRDDPAEREIRDLAARIFDRADWQWFSDGRKAVPMGWHPETGFIERNWDGFNEGMMIYILAMGSATHPLDGDGWNSWTNTYPPFWRGDGNTRHVAFAPLFGHQYSQLWIDFRGIADAPMRTAGLDYFENSRRATYANRAYCTANPMGWEGYSSSVWGLSACDGPGNFQLDYHGEKRTFFGYAARGPVGQPDGRDDGTITPGAALGSLPFAPEIVIPCAETIHREHGSRIYSRYGFLNSFNPSFKWEGMPLERGSVDPIQGWVAGDYIAIDQGPILAMAANYRSEFVWRLMRTVPAIRRGLERAGFTGGWLAA